MAENSDRKITLIGDSSGGNFCLSIVNQLSKENSKHLPGTVALVYPITQCFKQFPSHHNHALGRVLPEAMYMYILNYSGQPYTEENLERVKSITGQVGYQR